MSVLTREVLEALRATRWRSQREYHQEMGVRCCICYGHTTTEIFPEEYYNQKLLGCQFEDNELHGCSICVGCAQQAGVAW